MTSREEFRKYRSAAHKQKINIHGGTYSDAPQMALLESKHRVMDFSKKMLLLVILSISVHNCLSEDTRLYFEPRTSVLYYLV